MGVVFGLFLRMPCPGLTVKTRPGCAKNRKTVKNTDFWLSAGPVRVLRAALRVSASALGEILEKF